MDPIAVGYTAGGQTYLFRPGNMMPFHSVDLSQPCDDKFFCTQLEFTDGIEAALKVGESPKYFGIGDDERFHELETQVIAPRKASDQKGFMVLAAKRGDRYLIWNAQSEAFIDFDTRTQLIDYKISGRELHEQVIMFQRALENRPGFYAINAVGYGNELILTPM